MAAAPKVVPLPELPEGGAEEHEERRGGGGARVSAALLAFFGLSPEEQDRFLAGLRWLRFAARG